MVAAASVNVAIFKAGTFRRSRPTKMPWNFRKVELGVISVINYSFVHSCSIYPSKNALLWWLIWCWLIWCSYVLYMLYQMLSFSYVSWKGKIQGFSFPMLPCLSRAGLQMQGRKWERRQLQPGLEAENGCFFHCHVRFGGCKKHHIITHYNCSKATSTKKRISCQGQLVVWVCGLDSWDSVMKRILT